MKLIAILLLILPNLVFAHDDDKQPIQQIMQVTNMYNSTYYSQGVASAIAQSQLHFDGSTHQLQVSIGAGSYAQESAVSAGIAWKLGASGPLISGSISRDSSHTGVGIGATFRF